MRYTRRLLGGGGAVHPDAFKGGRHPGQLFARNVSQVTTVEWLALLCGITSFCIPLTLWYNKYFQLLESNWVDNNYDFSAPYQRDWAAKYAKPYKHLRQMSLV